MGKVGILLALAWLILGASLPQGQGSKEDRQAEQAIANSLENVATAIERGNEPPSYNPDCPKGADDRRSDLCAQWKAADAAHEAASWASWTWYLLLVGTVIGAATLGAAAAAAYFAKKAADHTETGAVAATNTLAHAREVSETQLRPYVFFGDAKLTLPLTNASEVIMPIKNHGLTPAFNLQVGMGVHSVKFPIGDQSREIEVDDWESAHALGPGDDTYQKSGFQDVSAEEMKGIREGTLAFLVRCVVRYEGRNGLTDEIEATMYIDKVTAIEGDVMTLNEWARHHAHEKHPVKRFPDEKA